MHYPPPEYPYHSSEYLHTPQRPIKQEHGAEHEVEASNKLFVGGRHTTRGISPGIQ